MSQPFITLSLNMHKFFNKNVLTNFYYSLSHDKNHFQTVSNAILSCLAITCSMTFQYLFSQTKCAFDQ